VSLTASAADFDADGFSFDVVSLSDLTCEVVFNDQYTGDVKIPSIVTYKGKTFTVTSIGNDAFYQRTITSVEIPNCVTSIGDYAFGGCKELTSVAIGNGVTNLGRVIFYTSPNITKIKVGSRQGFNSIYDNIKYTQGSLETIIIAEDYSDSEIFTKYKDPVYGTAITSYFYDLTSLKTLICEKVTPPTLGTNITNSQYMELEIQVPSASLAAYQAADVWKNFWNLKGIDETTGIEAVSVDGNKPTVVYGLNGIKRNNAKKGLNIINGKTVFVK